MTVDQPLPDQPRPDPSLAGADLDVDGASPGMASPTTSNSWSDQMLASDKRPSRNHFLICGAAEHERTHVIHVPGYQMLCDECIDNMGDVLAEKRAATAAEAVKP